MEVEYGTHVRWMIRRDLPAVLEIERESFDFPWDEDDFMHCLRARNCIGMVATKGDEVVGFMVYEIQQGQLHLLTLAVAGSHRRQGIGREMVDRLKSKLSNLTNRRNRIVLEVWDANLGGQLFFKAMGFLAVSVLREFFENPIRDAYLMRYRRSEIAAAPTEEYHDSMRSVRLVRNGV